MPNSQQKKNILGLSWTYGPSFICLSKDFSCLLPHVASVGYSLTSSDLNSELVSKSPPEGRGIAFLWSVKSRKITEIYFKCFFIGKKY